MRIVVDAMGGDHAPDEIVRGALEGARLRPEITLTLVGRPDRIEPLLAGAPPNVSLVPASQVIEMDEDPAKGLRGKPDASIRVGLGLVKSGQADAIISAGNTGALVGGATVPILGLGTLEGVKRPGIAVPAPTEDGFCALLDVGANKNCKPIHLLQYAVMGSVYFHYLRPEISNPRVGLLNIGEERTKGTELFKETYQLLEKSGINFVGNIEPHQMLRGKADVIVCDGFTGNMVLKMGEGISKFILKAVAEEAGESEVVRRAAAKITERFDYSALGGAPVLGVRGIVMKAHGRSDARAITSAVRTTADFVAGGLNAHIVDGLKRLSWWGRLSGWFLKPKDRPENP